MLYANQSDCKKIEAKIAEILGAAVNDKIIVDFKKFYASCHLQELRRIKFGDEVSDILTGTEFVQRHGLWVFVPDYDAGYSLFIRVALPHRHTATDRLLRCGILTEHVFESDARDAAPQIEIE